MFTSQDSVQGIALYNKHGARTSSASAGDLTYAYLRKIIGRRRADAGLGGVATPDEDVLGRAPSVNATPSSGWAGQMSHALEPCGVTIGN